MSSFFTYSLGIYLAGVVVNALIVVGQVMKYLEKNHELCNGFEWHKEKEFPLDIKRIIAYILFSWFSYVIILAVKLNS